jgi:hypothetical protein
MEEAEIEPKQVTSNQVIGDLLPGTWAHTGPPPPRDRDRPRSAPPLPAHQDIHPTMKGNFR